MRSCHFVAILLGVLAFSRLASADPTPSAAPQIVLLKLDDVVAANRPPGPVSPRWLRITNYLQTNHIKASFGVICESLEKDNPAYFQWLKDIQSGGLIELWMHGYHLKKADEPGEFDHGTVDKQRAILEKGEALAKAKLGFPLAAFGEHWSAVTDATDEAVQAVPDIKIWLYGPKQPKFFHRLSLPRVMGLENPTFVPDAVKFKDAYEKYGGKQPFLVLQGHPDQWVEDQRWEGFLAIIEYLKSKQVVFMTPSEYLQKVQPNL
ncbi:MAG TPA: DUF2334 domain-containing protein [Chthoniobacter sp.]|jgi:peptidoglycan/xylan/chitin deacetylase (PgdA/CDA1 family)